MHSTHRFVQHRARAIVVLLALFAAALVLAACGGSSEDDNGSGGSSADATTLLRQTFTGTHEIRSGKANIELKLVATGASDVNGPIKIGISGPFESAGTDELPKFDLRLAGLAQGQTFRAGLTSTSDELFVFADGANYKVPAQLLDQVKQRYRRSQQGSGSQQMSLKSLGIDPLSWLQDPTVEGSETVAGSETDHISAKLDVNALLDDVDKLLAKVKVQSLPGAVGQQIPSSIPPGARSEIEDAVKGATVDVWSGTDDHTLRRMTLSAHVVPPAGAGGARAVDITLLIELSDLNQPQTITAPATSRPLTELLGRLQDTFGGGSLGSSGSSGGATSEQLHAYSDCVERAGSDVTEAQRCAELLTK